VDIVLTLGDVLAMEVFHVKPGTAVRLTIRTLRELRGPYSQSEAAKLVGISPECYQLWELGRTQPSPSSLRKLLEHYVTWKRAFGQDPQTKVDEVLRSVFPCLPDQQPTEGE